ANGQRAASLSPPGRATSGRWLSSVTFGHEGDDEMNRRLHAGMAIASVGIGLAMADGYGHALDARQKPVRVEREYYDYSFVTTWDELVAHSDVVAEVVVNASVGGELEYF